jgi:hypothetical protein
MLQVVVLLWCTLQNIEDNCQNVLPLAHLLYLKIVMKLITGIKDLEHFSIVVLWDSDELEPMDNNLIQQVENEEVEEMGGIPVCSANLSSPVIDTANYIGEVHYKIGNRLYIEHAD